MPKQTTLDKHHEITVSVTPEVKAVYEWFCREGDVRGEFEAMLLRMTVEAQKLHLGASLSPVARDNVLLRLLLEEALHADQAVHKQYYLELIAEKFDIKIRGDHAPGVRP